MKYWLMLAILTLVLIAATAPWALARTDDQATSADGAVSADGRFALVSGPIRCTARQALVLRVTVTQASSGAIGEGHHHAFCSGALQTWTAGTEVGGTARFHAGRARVCVLAVTRHRGNATDAHQWCEEVRLTEAETH